MNMYELIPRPIYDCVSVYSGVNPETQFIGPMIVVAVICQSKWRLAAWVIVSLLDSTHRLDSNLRNWTAENRNALVLRSIIIRLCLYTRRVPS